MLENQNNKMRWIMTFSLWIFAKFSIATYKGKIVRLTISLKETLDQSYFGNRGVFSQPEAVPGVWHFALPFQFLKPILYQVFCNLLHLLPNEEGISHFFELLKRTWYSILKVNKRKKISPVGNTGEWNS